MEFDRQKGRWYYDEKKQTYPLVVNVPRKREGLDTVGSKVTDAERTLLGRWRDKKG